MDDRLSVKASVANSARALAQQLELEQVQRARARQQQREAEKIAQRRRVLAWRSEQELRAEAEAAAEAARRRRDEWARRVQHSASEEQRKQRAADAAARRRAADAAADADAASADAERRAAAGRANAATAARRQLAADKARATAPPPRPASARAREAAALKQHKEKRDQLAAARAARVAKAAAAEAEAAAAAAAEQAADAAAAEERRQRAQAGRAAWAERQREQLGLWKAEKEEKQRAADAEAEVLRRERAAAVEARNAMRAARPRPWSGATRAAAERDGGGGGGAVVGASAAWLPDLDAAVAGGADAAGAAADGEGDDDPTAARFLRPSEACKHVALVSYPRSGNSLLRSLLEASSRILTGSDALAGAALSQQLADLGLKGEGVVDGRVWLVKSHWPERRGGKPFGAHAAVLLVRNPFDAIDSYWNMVLTSSHTDSVRPAEYDRLGAEWSAHVAREAPVWAAFVRWWMRAPVPLLAIRYEDLAGAHREETLSLVSEFLCARAEAAADDAAPGALATLLERVRAAAGVDGVYRPRRRCEPSVLRFGGAEREVVLKECAAEMALFGYEIDAAKGDALGTVVGDGPKSIYLEAGGAAEEIGRPRRRGGMRLNVGEGLRPAEDPRGLRWRAAVESKRDESLLWAGAGRPAVRLVDVP